VGLHQCPSERKGEGGPVRSLHVPSHVPSHPQNAAKVRGFSRTASAFTAETDCLLEQAGFELPVPLVDAALDALADDLALELRCRVDEEFVPDSPLEGTGFEPSVPRKRPASSWCRNRSRRLFRSRGIKQKRHEHPSNLWWCHTVPMVRIRFPPAASPQTLGPIGQPRSQADRITVNAASMASTGLGAVLWQPA
jgi:hypothetical protein